MSNVQSDTSEENMTREQLERLAEKINGKWPETECESLFSGSVLHSPKFYLDLLVPDKDHGNPHFIVWCLDRLEELGMDLVILSAYKGKYCTWDSWSEDAESLNNVAPTRAEALALALLAKLEEE